MVSRRLFLTISTAAVAEKSVWQQRQIRHALHLGLGKGKGDISLLTGEGDARFRELMRAVRTQAEL